MKSARLSHSQVTPFDSTSKDIPSTLTKSQASTSRFSGRHGASPTPQLPITTLVTPFHEEQEISGSQQT